MNITETRKVKNPDGSENTKLLKSTIDGVTHWTPKNEANRHYREILKQVKEGKLTIKEAE